MCVSLIVKSKYKGSNKDYMTLKQFETYIKTGERPAGIWGELKGKSVAKNKKTIIKK